MAKSVTLKAQPLLSELSFEDGLKLLDELVQKVESGALPLETAIHSYEKGAKLIERLRGLLSGAEEKLELLSKAEGRRAESGKAK
ncbi:MAG: exodeoxyribonuclease VII small subunit [Proteobacteria bacterium]|nr:exodeoxyribonuclease VII small subunit [Pseudomonadota bacterium]